MSTNKRKEAAALFELIDKSTLKVPKNAGALKIPNWWSSKSNPPASPQTPASPAIGAPGSLVSRTNESSKPRPIPQSRITPPSTPPPPPPPPPRPPIPSPIQTTTLPAIAPRSTEQDSPPTPPHRLFDPPPAHANPSLTPSIRPPSQPPVIPPTKPPVSSSSTVKNPPSTNPPPPPSKTTEPLPDTALDDLPLPEPEAPPRRTFAPNTHAQSGQPWSPQRGGSFVRLPTWVKLFASAAVLIIIVCCIFGLVHLLAQGHNTTTQAASPGILGTSTPVTPAPLAPPGMGTPPPHTLIPAPNNTPFPHHQ